MIFMQVIILTLYTHFNSDAVYRVSSADIQQHINCSLGGNLCNLKILVHVPSYQKSAMSASSMFK